MLEIVNYNSDEYDFPALIVLGCFDAIHIGHAELLKKAKLQAKINGLDLGVMMFAEGKGGRQVFTFEERLSFLSAYNAKFVLKIDYTDEFKKTAPLDFLHNIEEHINAKAYMSGKDFRFGAGAKGKSFTLKNYADDEDNGVWYMPVKDIMVDGEKVSTTLIKSCIESGNIQRANALLGREYFVSGEVCTGHGRGRELGFPTANIVYPENKVLVKTGVYGVEAEIDGAMYRGVANCGPRPTFGEDTTVLEVYFEGLSEDLYGKTITVKFLNYIRSIKKFDSAEELSAQIARDEQMVGAPDNLSDEAECVPAAVEPHKAVEEQSEEAAADEVSVEQPEETAAEELPEREAAEGKTLDEATAAQGEACAACQSPAELAEEEELSEAPAVEYVSVCCTEFDPEQECPAAEPAAEDNGAEAVAEDSSAAEDGAAVQENIEELAGELFAEGDEPVQAELPLQEDEDKND